jgi:hypothetical protein
MMDGMPQMRAARRLVLAATVVALSVWTTAGSAPALTASGRSDQSSAVAARAILVNETLHALPIGHHSPTEYSDRGRGSGTFNCPLTVHVNISYTNTTFTFVCSPKGGTLKGRGEASFYVAGQIAHFRGSLWVTQGTGQYAHASNTRLAMTGSLQRHTYALSAIITGKMSI